MQIEVDTHTHSILSGHAFSTLQEMAGAAAEKGLKRMCLTDHGPQIPGSSPYFTSGMYVTMPEYIEGVRIHYGLELNIIDYEGGVDLPPRRQKHLEFALAGMHEITLPHKTKEAHTNSYEMVFANPYIDAISHPGSAYFNCDIEAVVRAAKLFGKLIEINNHTFNTRQKSIPNCILFAEECVKQDVRVIVSSDAHYSGNVGVVDKAMAMLGSIDFPKELIANLTEASFQAYLDERMKRTTEA